MCSPMPMDTAASATSSSAASMPMPAAREAAGATAAGDSAIEASRATLLERPKLHRTLRTETRAKSVASTP